MNESPLSTSFLRNTNSILRELSVSVLGVGSDLTENIADFVRRVRNEKGFSQPDVEKNSGYTITDGYVSQIENGYIKNVSPEKLRALAKGLGISEEEIFAIARGKVLGEPETPADFGVLFFGWEEASDEEKTATMEAIKMIAESFQGRRINGKATFSGGTELTANATVKSAAKVAAEKRQGEKAQGKKK